MALKLYKVIDENGKIIGSNVLNDELDEIPENHVLGWGSEQSFFEPVYDFEAAAWKETKLTEEIEAYKNEVAEMNAEIPRNILEELDALKADFETVKNENALLKSENGKLKTRVADTENAVLGIMNLM